MNAPTRTTSTHSSSLVGLNAPARVRIHASTGRSLDLLELSGFDKEASARETRVRVLSALAGIGRTVERPVLVRVDGHPGGPTAHLDLAIAVAVARFLDPALPDSSEHHFVGELALDGRLRPVRGARLLGLEGVINYFPADNGAELRARDENVPIVLAAHLRDVLDGTGTPLAAIPFAEDAPARRGLVFPHYRGAGRSFPNIPAVSALQFARAYQLSLPVRTASQDIHSVAGLISERGPLTAAPFRAPHHSVSEAGLVGGGDWPRPGEVSLAHGGVLLLDELTEFRTAALDALFDALARGSVTFTRGSNRISFPARPNLVACSAEAGPALHKLVQKYSLHVVTP